MAVVMSESGASSEVSLKRVAPETSLLQRLEGADGEAFGLHEPTPYIPGAAVDAQRRQAVAPQVLVAQAALILGLAKVTAEGRLLAVPMEVVVAVARAPAKGRASKRTAHDASRRAILEAIPADVHIPVRKRATDQPQALAVRAVAAARRAGVRIRLAVAGRLPRADLAPSVGAPQAGHTQVRVLRPLPVAVVLAAPGRAVDVRRRRATRRPRAPASLRRLVDDEVAVRNAEPFPTSHVLVGLRAGLGRQAVRAGLVPAVAASLGDVDA